MGARQACKLVDDSRVDDSRVDDSRAVDSPVDDSRAVDYPVGEIQVAFLSLVDRACQVDLDWRGTGDRELGDRAWELADRVCQVGQDSVDFRSLRRAVFRDDRVGRALSRVVQVESLRAASPGEFPVETVAQAESREPFQVGCAGRVAGRPVSGSFAPGLNQLGMNGRSRPEPIRSFSA